ncbi:MAG: flavodoxin [Methanospirillaceae archaeon]|nr:flavodoxin [Methanospirillaceae archaeon]
MSTILVTYKTRTATTAEISQAIGNELTSMGHDIFISPIQEVSSIEKYDAIVFGAPVYMGHVEKELFSFVKKEQELLKTRPIAIFIVGIAPVLPDKTGVLNLLDQIKKTLSPIKPVTVTMFAGRLEREKVSFVKRKLIDFMKVPTGDFRNWDEIRAWAQSLPALFWI